MLSAYLRISSSNHQSPSCARATRPPVHHGDLKEFRSLKIISNIQRDHVKRHHDLQKCGYKETVKQRRAMIQWSLVYDDPCQSVFSRQWEPGEVDGPRGLWSFRREPEWIHPEVEYIQSAIIIPFIKKHTIWEGVTWWWWAEQRFCQSSVPLGTIFLTILTTAVRYKPFLLWTSQAMSLETFWPQSFNKMGRARGNRDKRDVPSEPGDDTQDGDQAEFETVDGLDPAFAKALSVMTSNIIKVIDEKLSPLAETIHKLATLLQAASRWFDEAEARLPAVENSRWKRRTLGQPRWWLNLQWNQGLFLQWFLLDGDDEMQGIWCAETAAARARDASRDAVPCYSTGDTGGTHTFIWLSAWMTTLRSKELCFSGLGDFFCYTHSCLTTHSVRSCPFSLDIVAYS